MDELSEGIAALQRRTLLARIAIYIFLAFTALSIVISMLLYGGVIAPDLVDPELDVASLAISVAQIVFLLSAIFVGMWIHRAHRNLFAAGLQGLEFTPGWSVGWFFIPIMSLFRPFQAMRELWNRSLGEDDSYASVTPSEVGIWWGTFLAGNFLGTAGGSENFAAGSGILLVLVVSSVCDLVCAAFLLKIIDTVVRAQKSMLGVAETFA